MSNSDAKSMRSSDMVIFARHKAERVGTWSKQKTYATFFSSTLQTRSSALGPSGSERKRPRIAFTSCPSLSHHAAIPWGSHSKTYAQNPTQLWTSNESHAQAPSTGSLSDDPFMFKLRSYLLAASKRAPKSSRRNHALHFPPKKLSNSCRLCRAHCRLLVQDQVSRPFEPVHCSPPALSTPHVRVASSLRSH
jgi:hypothetical protein